MPNIDIRRELDTLAQDESLLEMSVKLDTSRWSTRKRKLVLTALDYGVADCGRGNVTFIKQLFKSYGMEIPGVYKGWGRQTNDQRVYYLNDTSSSYDDFTAYLIASLKLTDPTYRAYDVDPHWGITWRGATPKERNAMYKQLIKRTPEELMKADALRKIIERYGIVEVRVSTNEDELKAVA